MARVHVVHLDGDPRQQMGYREVIQGKKDRSNRMHFGIS